MFLRLRDVLLMAGVDPNDKSIQHVHLEGADVDPTGKPYGASIPFEKAMRPEVCTSDISSLMPVRACSINFYEIRIFRWLSRTAWTERIFRGTTATLFGWLFPVLWALARSHVLFDLGLGNWNEIGTSLYKLCKTWKKIIACSWNQTIRQLICCFCFKTPSLLPTVFKTDFIRICPFSFCTITFFYSEVF